MPTSQISFSSSFRCLLHLTRNPMFRLELIQLLAFFAGNHTKGIEVSQRQNPPWPGSSQGSKPMLNSKWSGKIESEKWHTWFPLWGPFSLCSCLNDTKQSDTCNIETTTDRHVCKSFPMTRASKSRLCCERFILEESQVENKHKKLQRTHARFPNS